MSEEAQALRQETEQPREQLQSQGAGKTRRLRRTVVAVLSVATAMLIVFALVASWTTGTALNTAKFVDRVGPIVDEPSVRAAVSVELGNQLVDVLDVQNRLRPVLPDRLGLLAIPIGSAVDEVVRKQVIKFVDSPAFRKLWYQSLRVSHARVVQGLTGSSANVQIVRGFVVIDLLNVTRQVLAELPSSVQAVVGNGLASQIPDGLPSDALRLALSRYLGVTLPDDFGQVPVMDASALESARKGVRVLNLSVLLIVLLAAAALGGTIWLSPNRRRTLVQLGLWTAGMTAVVFFAVREVTKAVLAGITDVVFRPAIADALRTVFESLRTFGSLLFWISLLLALVAYLVGPGRLPRRLRGQVAGNQAARAWLADNLDALRVGGLVVAGLTLLLWSGWTTLALVGVLLLAFEVAVTVLASGGRDLTARPGAAGEPVEG